MYASQEDLTHLHMWVTLTWHTFKVTYVNLKKCMKHLVNMITQEHNELGSPNLVHGCISWKRRTHSYIYTNILFKVTEVNFCTCMHLMKYLKRVYIWVTLTYFLRSQRSTYKIAWRNLWTWQLVWIKISLSLSYIYINIFLPHLYFINPNQILAASSLRWPLGLKRCYNFNNLSLSKPGHTFLPFRVLPPAFKFQKCHIFWTISATQLCYTLTSFSMHVVGAWLRKVIQFNTGGILICF